MRKTKKLLSIILVCITIFGTSVTAFAAEEPNQTEYSESKINKLKANIEKIYSNDEEKADAFLSSVGIGDKWLDNFSKEKKIELYSTANSVGILDEYFVETENGTIKEITQREYMKQETVEKTRMTSTMASRANCSDSNEDQDNYFKKSIIWIGSSNNSGYFAVFTIFEWLKPPLIRNIDGLFLTSATGSFPSDTSGCIVQYTQTAYMGNTVVVDEITETYSKENGDEPEYGPVYIGYQFDLPNDVTSMSTSVKVSNLAVMLFSGYYIDEPDARKNVTLYGTYFHRNIKISSSVSVASFNEGTITLDLEWQYKKYEPIEGLVKYVPQKN